MTSTAHTILKLTLKFFFVLLFIFILSYKTISEELKSVVVEIGDLHLSLENK